VATVEKREQLQPLPEDLSAVLGQVSTATLWTQLYRRGFRNQFLRDVRPLRPDMRFVGRARTLRYLPAREDVLAALEREPQRNAQRLVIEAIEPGDVLVIEARGETGAGVLGDILAARVQARGGVAIVTDGSFRDTPGIVALGIAAYARGQHAGLSQSLHVPVDWDVPIACGGVTVLPGDVLVGDGEGVVVLPRDIAEEVAAAAAEQEALEAFILEKVRSGAPLAGTYPPDERTKREFEVWRQSRRSS
jgi:regulator of RNase E activity RraA